MKVAKARKQQILPNLDRHAEAAGASTVTSTALALEQNGAGFEESDGEARRAEDTVATPPYAVGARSRFARYAARRARWARRRRACEDLLGSEPPARLHLDARQSRTHGRPSVLPVIALPAYRKALTHQSNSFFL